MSAYLCDSYQIGRMAAYIISGENASYVHYHADAINAATQGSDLAAQVGSLLAAANVASIQGRYPDTAADFAGAPGVVSETKDGVLSYISLCAQAARLEWRGDHTPAEMITAADNFSYQACEYEGWKTSDAFRLVAFMKDGAVSELLRSLDLKTAWGLSVEDSKRVQGISLADLSEG
jgi:hypothetical protein